jgi:hypothetical protein
MAKRDGRGRVFLRAERVYYAGRIHPDFHRVDRAIVRHLGPSIETFDLEKLSTLEVKKLDLSYNEGRLFYTNLISTLPFFKKLRLLKLKQTNFFNTTPEAMVSAIAQTNITGVDLTSNYMGDSTVSLRGLKLISLRASNTMIGSGTPLDGLLVPDLEFLDLSHNDLGSRNGEEKLAALGEYLEESTTLFYLNLSYNSLNAQSDGVMKKFISSLEVLEKNIEGFSNHDFSGNFSRGKVSAALEKFHQRRTKREPRWRRMRVMLWIREQEENICSTLPVEILRFILSFLSDSSV